MKTDLEGKLALVEDFMLKAKLDKRAQYRLEFMKRNEKIKKFLNSMSVVKEIMKIPEDKREKHPKYKKFAELVNQLPQQFRRRNSEQTISFVTALGMLGFKSNVDPFYMALLMGLSPIEIVHILNPKLIGKEIIISYPNYLGELIRHHKIPANEENYNNPLSRPMIRAVNKWENTIVLKIHLDRSIGEILNSIKFVIKYVEAHLYRKRRRTRFKELDKYLRIYDLKKSNPSKWTWSKIAKEVYPTYFDTGNLQNARDLVKKHYRETCKMIDKFQFMEL
jgi:hypothetical protein